MTIVSARYLGIVINVPLSCFATIFDVVPFNAVDLRTVMARRLDRG